MLVKGSDSIRLFQHVDPYLRKLLDDIFLRQLREAESARVVQYSDIPPLPLFSKYLLIASYIASYNPAKTDTRFFTKAGGGKLRRSKKERGEKAGTASHLRVKQILLGPKAFALQRMLAIFYTILDEPIENTVDILLQIANMINLRLLIQVSSSECLDNVKLKCNIGFDVVSVLAKSVDMDIVQYLSDYLLK